MALRILLVNTAVFIGLLLLIELVVRYGPFTDTAMRGPSKSTQDLEYATYTMFHRSGSNVRDMPIIWNDRINHRWIEAVQGRNNHGFRLDEDVNPWQEYAKAPNERVVVLTGGSAMHGTGSTSNDTTIDAYMERELNARQDRYHYRVLNFGMGSWNTFQNLLGLMLYAKPYQPDWVVVMDGHNDVAGCCGLMQGPTEVGFSSLIRSYVNGYLARNPKPDFYRGEFENWLVTHSAAYRKITGKAPVERIQQFTAAVDGSGQVANVDVHWEDVSRQLAFYLRCESMIVEQFAGARIILSLQPDLQSPEKIFNKSPAYYENIDEKMAGRLISDDPLRWRYVAMNYFYFLADRKMRQYVESLASPDIRYFNMNYVFPADERARGEFMIDSMHMNDKGAERIGHFYALQILASDFPQQREEYEKEASGSYGEMP